MIKNWDEYLLEKEKEQLFVVSIELTEQQAKILSNSVVKDFVKVLVMIFECQAKEKKKVQNYSIVHKGDKFMAVIESVSFDEFA